MKNKQFAVLFLSCVNVMIGYGLVIPFIAVYQDYFGVSLMMIGLMISFYALGQFIFAPIAGDFNNRFGERKVLVISQIAFALFTIIVFAVHVFWIMLFFRFLTGMCAAGIYSSSENFIATNAKSTVKTRYIMLLSVASGLGMIIGPLLGIYIVEIMAIANNYSDAQILNVAALFVLFFVAYVFIIAFLAFMFLPKDFKKHESVESVKLKTYFPKLFKQIFSMCKSVKMLFILSGFFLYGYLTSSIETYLLTYVMENYSLDKLLLFSEGLIIAILAFVFFAKISPKLESKFLTITLLIAYLLVPAISFAVLSLSPPLGVFFPLFVIVMGTSAIFTSLLVVFISEEVKAPGVVLGVKNSIISIGMILGPIISGIFFQMSSTHFMLQLAVILFVVALFGYYIKHAFYKEERR